MTTTPAPPRDSPLVSLPDFLLARAREIEARSDGYARWVDVTTRPVPRGLRWLERLWPTPGPKVYLPHPDVQTGLAGAVYVLVQWWENLMDEVVAAEGGPAPETVSRVWTLMVALAQGFAYHPDHRETWL